MTWLRTTGLRAPLPLGWGARRARELIDGLTGRLSSETADVPPRRLRARTGAPGRRDFLLGGRAAAEELAAALATTGPDFAEVGSVLDLGCGSGRVLPHVAARAPAADCAGCDVDAAAISWAADHFPNLRWVHSGAEPPLPFKARSFELIYSISVFSHLGEGAQDRWLEEVRRLLAPGGTALLSVHGAHAFEAFRTGRVKTGWCRHEAFDRGPLGPDEFVFEPYRRTRWNRGELPGVGAEYGLAFHGERYVRSHWAATLDVRAVLPRAMTSWQDVVCVRA